MKCVVDFLGEVVERAAGTGDPSEEPGSREDLQGALDQGDPVETGERLVCAHAGGSPPGEDEAVRISVHIEHP